MRKGEETRSSILDHALRVATTVGLEGLSIGPLAKDLGMSKSGLFAHFQSKEALQIQVLETAAALFVERVLAPALKAPRGVPRLQTLFERWLVWAESAETPGGCLFVTAAVELDDRPGEVRDALVRIQKDWFDSLARAARSAVDEGQFRADFDAEQFAHDLYAILLGYHHAARLLRSPKARERASRAFESLLAASAAR